YAPHAVDIDEDLATHSRDWPLHRMPAVDRAILRLGAAEVLYGEEESRRGTIIGEYTKIAEVLSTDDSPRFVNGLLQRLVDVRGLLSCACAAAARRPPRPPSTAPRRPRGGRAGEPRSRRSRLGTLARAPHPLTTRPVRRGRETPSPTTPRRPPRPRTRPTKPLRRTAPACSARRRSGAR